MTPRRHARFNPPATPAATGYRSARTSRPATGSRHETPHPPATLCHRETLNRPATAPDAPTAIPKPNGRALPKRPTAHGRPATTAGPAGTHTPNAPATRKRRRRIAKMLADMMIRNSGRIRTQRTTPTPHRSASFPPCHPNRHTARKKQAASTLRFVNPRAPGATPTIHPVPCTRRTTDQPMPPVSTTRRTTGSTDRTNSARSRTLPIRQRFARHAKTPPGDTPLGPTPAQIRTGASSTTVDRVSPGGETTAPTARWPHWHRSTGTRPSPPHDSSTGCPAAGSTPRAARPADSHERRPGSARACARQT